MQRQPILWRELPSSIFHIPELELGRRHPTGGAPILTTYSPSFFAFFDSGNAASALPP
jgi:hypothetical protein